MIKKKMTVTLVAIFLILFYLSPKGVLLPTDAKAVTFENRTLGEVPCPSELQVKMGHYQREQEHFVNFTLYLSGIPKANTSLRGLAGEYFCTREGILIYAYNPKDEGKGSRLALFDYGLNLKWQRGTPGIPYAMTERGLILKASANPWKLGFTGVQLLDLSTGRLLQWLYPCSESNISDVKVVGTRMYVTVKATRGPPLETYILIYVNENGKYKKEEITSVLGESIEFRLPLDANEKYAVVAYFLANEHGEEKNGLCVFTAGSLRKLACKEFGDGERPLKVKLEGNIVYVQTTKGVKAYKILSLW
ncbi:hypothetical protein [Thermococcus thermotolerans]|uniref:hypothetical protein n=1 Tax=Thermococcus thermotolerans TaxID=2969672 RepID=UPI002157330E|nr:hypothetical protein [Thermococcus thermotolerans]